MQYLSLMKHGKLVLMYGVMKKHYVDILANLIVLLQVV